VTAVLRAPSAPPATITVDGVTLELVVTRKPVRNVNTRLHGSTLRVSAPPGLAAGELERIVVTLARTLLRRRRGREVNGEAGLDELVRGVARRFPSPPQVAAVLLSTTQRSRWGSYSAATGTIRLHAALRAMPPWVLEAVVAHELTHVFHRHHSSAFWALLRQVCPDADRARAFLAGVSWLACRWPSLPTVERAQLAEATEDSGADE
jgi:predicted metal-dependent hydrolase